MTNQHTDQGNIQFNSTTCTVTSSFYQLKLQGVGRDNNEIFEYTGRAQHFLFEAQRMREIDHTGKWEDTFKYTVNSFWWVNRVGPKVRVQMSPEVRQQVCTDIVSGLGVVKNRYVGTTTATPHVLFSELRE